MDAPVVRELQRRGIAMRKNSKLEGMRKPFVVTVAVGALTGCGGSVAGDEGEGGGNGGSGGDGKGNTGGSVTGTGGIIQGTGGVSNTGGWIDIGTGGGTTNPPPPPTTYCPTAAPYEGEWCNYAGPGCLYGPYCVTIPTVQASCVNNAWTLAYSTCNPPPPQCPPVLPQVGEPCVGMGGCEYPGQDSCNVEGGWQGFSDWYAECLGGAWQLYETTYECNPPPPIAVDAGTSIDGGSG